MDWCIRHDLHEHFQADVGHLWRFQGIWKICCSEKMFLKCTEQKAWCKLPNDGKTEGRKPSSMGFDTIVNKVFSHFRFQFIPFRSIVIFDIYNESLSDSNLPFLSYGSHKFFSWKQFGLYIDISTIKFVIMGTWFSFLTA
jgi:hypothetical protein